MFPPSVENLIEQLAKLPSIGPKTAERLTYYMLKQDGRSLEDLSDAVANLKKDLHTCSTCFNISKSDPCTICANPQRNQHVICVVEEFLDLTAIEKTKTFQGTYHVLHGSIAPLQGIGPKQLKINQLLERISEQTEEIIIATNPTMEGEATAMYIKKQLSLSPFSVPISRIAKGIPMGGDLEYADNITISNSLEKRTAF